MAAFEMSRARDFWTHFPNAARPAPELEVESPAYVVVFDGPTHVTGLSTRKGGSDGLTTQLLDGVVCVLLPPNDLLPDGETLVYYGVSTQGFRP